MNKRPNPKEIDKACYDAMIPLGIGMKYGLGSWPIDDHFSGWVGLNQGVHPTFIRVNPHIGIHCVAAMKLLAESQGAKYRKGEFATFSCFIGTRCPDVQQIIFENEADILPEATRLAEIVKEYGMPYIHSLTSYDALLPRLLEDVEGIGGAAEKYAVTLYSSGDVQGAFNFIDEQSIKFLAQKRTPWVDSLKKLKVFLEMRQ